MRNFKKLLKIELIFLISETNIQILEFGRIMVLFLLILFSSSLFAQYNIRLAGFIHDAETDQPLIAAIVEVKENHLFSFTNTQGYFEIQNLEPGSLFNFGLSSGI